MGITYNEGTKEFHLFNQNISYVMNIMPNQQIGQLYFGKRVEKIEDSSYLFETIRRSMTQYVFDNDLLFSLEHVKQEFPSFGTTDYRYPAVDILQKNGSRITNFVFVGYEIAKGKPKLEQLPATYTESQEEATTLKIILEDEVMGVSVELLYTVFETENAIARSVTFRNKGKENVAIQRALSMCLDLPDCDYKMLQLSGSWGRERYLKFRELEQGVQSVGSMKGNSGPQHNPFIALMRKNADEFQGEVIGCNLIYSGNFLAQIEVDTYDVSRILLGINPYQFSWELKPGDAFQTPEAVIVYSDNGLNAMSQTYHRLYQSRLVRGSWRGKERPILINNWEATRFSFEEEQILSIAQKAKEVGIELFVLDDGWFGNRPSELSGLGDWVCNRKKLPIGIGGLSEKIAEMGMEFGLWFEPEMVNKDSDLYRAHPDWILETPNRHASHGRFQHVLDFSNQEVVNHIHMQISKVIRESKISYVKWDMNRSITECYSRHHEANQQGEIYHRYILGVYDLYERLIKEFPSILFESCASGGGRFDAGMLYYAPQCWTSDDTDSVERLKIQYGTSLCYPISSMGSHVSAVPNAQISRATPLSTRANVAYFGTFGYELDLNKLTEEEIKAVKEQIRFMKKYRRLIQFGTFYRLQSPFEGNVTSWMVVSADKKEAIVGYYHGLTNVNGPYSRIKLKGLDKFFCYEISEGKGRHYGDELMNIGLITSDGTSGRPALKENKSLDFMSKIFELKAIGDGG